MTIRQAMHYGLYLEREYSPLYGWQWLLRRRPDGIVLSVRRRAVDALQETVRAALIFELVLTR